MVLKPVGFKSTTVPPIQLGNTVLNYTDTNNYLGCFIADDFSDNYDIKCRVRGVYA